MNGRLLVLGLALLLGTSPALASPLNSLGRVLNEPPQAQGPDASASDDDGATPGVQVQPSAGTSRNVEVTIEADDGNGHNDVSSAEVTVYKPDGSTVHNGIQDEKASRSQGQGKRATYAHSFAMEHYDPPGTYTIEVTITDRQGSTDTSNATFTYESLGALSTDTQTVAFQTDGGGSLAPGADSHTTPANVTIENAGNVEIDLAYSGTDLDDGTGNRIAVSNVHLDTDQDGDLATNERTLATTTQTDTSFGLAPSTALTTSTAFVLSALHVPSPQPTGTYTGSITLEAVTSS